MKKTLDPKQRTSALAFPLTETIGPVAIRAMALCILIAVVFAREAHPFYKLMESHGKPNGHVSLTKPSTPGNIKNTFYFYDNFSQSNKTGDPIPLVYPGSVFFVPADKISYNISLLPGRKNTLSREKTLDNFLYANFNILMLLKEYETLRKELSNILRNPDPALKGKNQNPTRSIYLRKKELDKKWHRISTLRSLPSIGNSEQTAHPDKRDRIENRTQIKLLREIISRQEKIQFDQNQIDKNETLSTPYKTESLERSWIMEKIIQLVKFMLHQKITFMMVGAVIFFSLKLISFITKNY